MTEPAIYGITLPKKKPFIITCIVSAITGAIIAASGAKYYIVPGMGVFGYTAFMNTQTQNITGMIWAIGASILALVGGFAAVYLTYKEKEVKKLTTQLKDAVSAAKTGAAVFAERGSLTYDQVEPAYMRIPEAERKLREKQAQERSNEKV